MVDLISIFIIVLLVLLSGLFSGLTLGLMGLNKTDLERKIKLGNKDAEKIYRVRKDGNQLLSTLLLGNVAVNAILAIFLGNIASGVVAGIFSTALIVIFGEIIPQATISRHAMKIGAKSVWFVELLMVLFLPVCWPIARILDKSLGEELPTIWSRHELAEIIKHHEDSPESSIDAEEENIILGALSFSRIRVDEVMTPRDVVFSIEANEVIDIGLLNIIKNSGFTRIPVYDDTIDNIVGILYTKDLIVLNGKFESGLKVGDQCRKNCILIVNETDKLDDLFNLFIQKKVHMAIVLDEFASFRGIVTLEDVIEEIFRLEIMDEEDKIADLRSIAKTKAKFRFEKYKK